MSDTKAMDEYFRLHLNFLKTCESFLPKDYDYTTHHLSIDRDGKECVVIRSSITVEKSKYLSVPMEEFTERFNTLLTLDEFNTKFDLVSKDWYDDEI